jgi:tetratricopeptide (TPR) repeat protein
MLAHPRWLLFALLAGAAAGSGSAAAHPGPEEQHRTLDEALRSSPEDPALHLQRGRLHAKSKDWDAALDAYARAAAHGADPEAVALLEGAAFLNAGWPRMAMRRFDAVLALDPARFDAHIGRGRALMQLGRPQEAAGAFQAGVRGMSKPTPVHVLEWRSALVASDRKGEALSALDEGMRRTGPIPSLELAAVDIALELGRHDDALRRLERVLARNPDQPEWVARRGEVLAQAGRTDEARASYQRALELIEERNAHRRTRGLDELQERLRTTLAANAQTGEERP